MTNLLVFLTLLLTSIVTAWLFAIFTAWWIGMTIMTAITIVATAHYLREIVENYILL